MTTPLDDLLGRWADARGLSPAQADAIRNFVIRDAAADEDWLRDLLRPVTALLDGPHSLYDTLTRAYVRELTHA